MLRESGEFQVVGLLTTANEAFWHVAMHAVRIALLRAQAEAAGLPLWEMELPYSCSNDQCEEAMGQAMAVPGAKTSLRWHLATCSWTMYAGSAKIGCTEQASKPVFPLWGRPTLDPSRVMLAAGLEAHFTCVDPKQVVAISAGRAYDQSALHELPATVDPCGERGECPTFVHDGPMFARPVPVRAGEVVERDGFVSSPI